MNCKKQNKQKKSNVITRVPNILKRQKAFWFLFPCALESLCRNARSVVAPVVYRGSLKARQLPVCMVFAKKKCLLREESFTIFFFFSGLFATLDLKGSPPSVPSFLGSTFCMLHLEPAHRAISPMYNKELFLCLSLSLTLFLGYLLSI